MYRKAAAIALTSVTSPWTARAHAPHDARGAPGSVAAPLPAGVSARRAVPGRPWACVAGRPPPPGKFSQTYAPESTAGPARPALPSPDTKLRPLKLNDSRIFAWRRRRVHTNDAKIPKFGVPTPDTTSHPVAAVKPGWCDSSLLVPLTIS